MERTLAGLDVVALRSSPEVIAALAEILIETVAAGGSVSFMHPLAPDVAAAFWTHRWRLPTLADGWCWARCRTNSSWGP